MRVAPSSRLERPARDRQEGHRVHPGMGQADRLQHGDVDEFTDPLGGALAVAHGDRYALDRAACEKTGLRIGF